MNISTFERAQVAGFAYRQARHTGSLDCMKAICYVLRNRVKAGWGDGSWLSVLAAQDHAEGNVSEAPAPPLDAADRLLQLLLRDIDDLYLGTSEDDTKTVVNKALYYQFVDQVPVQWFIEHIVRDPANHPRKAQVGPILLFE